MKAKTAIYVQTPASPVEILRSPETVQVILGKMDQLPPQGTLAFNRLTGAGKVRRSYIPAPTIVRVEEL